MPWTARKAARLYIEVANDASAEPTMKIEIAKMKSFLRP